MQLESIHLPGINILKAIFMFWMHIEGTTVLPKLFYSASKYCTVNLLYEGKGSLQLVLTKTLVSMQNRVAAFVTSESLVAHNISKRETWENTF